MSTQIDLVAFELECAALPSGLWYKRLNDLTLAHIEELYMQIGGNNSIIKIDEFILVKNKTILVEFWNTNVNGCLEVWKDFQTDAFLNLLTIENEKPYL